MKKIMLVIVLSSLLGAYLPTTVAAQSIEVSNHIESMKAPKTAVNNLLKETDDVKKPLSIHHRHMHVKTLTELPFMKLMPTQTQHIQPHHFKIEALHPSRHLGRQVAAASVVIIIILALKHFWPKAAPKQPTKTKGSTLFS